MKIFSSFVLPLVLGAAGLAATIASAQETTSEEKATTQVVPVAVKSVDGKTIARLAPENTKIEFIGTHVGDDPKPRLGGFKTFAGTIGVEDNKPVSVSVEMEISSIWTEFDNLTKHLMNSDFFESAKFPKASFKSTAINVLGEGTCTIAGELTLHGTSSQIEFPAKYKMQEGGLVLMADFQLDRTEFGMDKMTDGVEKLVSLSVVVGQPTRGVESKSGNGSDQSDQDQASSESTTPMESMTVKISLPNMS